MNFSQNIVPLALIIVLRLSLWGSHECGSRHKQEGGHVTHAYMKKVMSHTYAWRSHGKCATSHLLAKSFNTKKKSQQTKQDLCVYCARMCVCVHRYLCAHTRVCVCVRERDHVCMCVWERLCVRMCVCVCMYMSNEQRLLGEHNTHTHTLSLSLSHTHTHPMARVQNGRIFVCMSHGYARINEKPYSRTCRRGLYSFETMGWLWIVGSIKLYVSFEKETYKRDDILQKRRIILSIIRE